MEHNDTAASADPARRPANPNGGVIPEFSLGDRLRKAREVAGYEQISLAAEIDVHRQTVARYESGASTPRRPVLISWAMTTGVSLEWLATGSTGEREISTHVEESVRSTDLVDSRD